jgi:hypothetical protein
MSTLRHSKAHAHEPLAHPDCLITTAVRQRYALLRQASRHSVLLAAFVLTMIASYGSGKAAAPGPRGCYDPADFGAIPDDGIDDRVPSQQAPSCLPASGQGGWLPSNIAAVMSGARKASLIAFKVSLVTALAIRNLLDRSGVATAKLLPPCMRPDEAAWWLPLASRRARGRGEVGARWRLSTSVRSRERLLTTAAAAASACPHRRDPGAVLHR